MKYKISLENKTKADSVEKSIKVECECGNLVNFSYMKRHLNSKIHNIALKLKNTKKQHNHP